MSTLRTRPPPDAAPSTAFVRVGGTVGVVVLLTVVVLLEAFSTNEFADLLAAEGAQATVQALALVAACGTVGALLLAGLVTAGGGGERRTAEVRHLLAAATGWSILWAVASCGSALLLVVQAGSEPLDPVTLGHGDGARDGGTGTAVRAAVATAWAAGMVALLARSAVRLRFLLGCLLLSYSALLPGVLVGHAGHADARLLAVVATAVHVLAVTTWVGGLLALVSRPPGDASAVARAFSTVALVCFATVGVSGVLNLMAQGTPATLGDGTHRWLLLGKVVGLVILGVAGAVHRRHTLRRLVSGRPRSFLVLAAGELVVMAGVVAGAIVLARTAG